MVNNKIIANIGGSEIGCEDLHATELETGDIEVFISALRRYWDALDDCEFDVQVRVTEK